MFKILMFSFTIAIAFLNAEESAPLTSSPQTQVVKELCSCGCGCESPCNCGCVKGATCQCHTSDKKK